MPHRRDSLKWGAALASTLLWPAQGSAAAPGVGEQARVYTGVVRKRVHLRYLLWMPRTAPRPARGWPLLFFLHGSGERGDDLARVKVHGLPKQAAAGAEHPFVLVAPQVPAGLAWDSDALEALRAHLVARLPIDPDRVLMTGLSMGGIGTWNYAADYPDRLAAIAPVSGFGDVDRADRLARVATWAFHGALDDAVPIVDAQMTVDAVRAAGGRVTFTVYPDLGHNAWDRAYADPQLVGWLLAQRRSTARAQ
jgi:predicted peptidase